MLLEMRALDAFSANALSLSQLLSLSLCLVTQPYLRRSLILHRRHYYYTNGRSSTSTHRLELQCDRRNPWPKSLTRDVKEKRNMSYSDVIVSLYFVNWIRLSNFQIWQSEMFSIWLAFKYLLKRSLCYFKYYYQVMKMIG